jgi:hypothetical protein
MGWTPIMEIATIDIDLAKDDLGTNLGTNKLLLG